MSAELRVNIDAKGVLVAGVAAGAAYTLYRLVHSLRPQHGSEDGAKSSKTADDACHRAQRLQLHYPSSLLPAPAPDSKQPASAILEALRRAQQQWAPQLALLCERHCSALQDFTGEGSPPTALVLGCGPGGTAFELARSFADVLAVDASSGSIRVAQEMQSRGRHSFRVPWEGAAGDPRTARLEAEVEPERVHFMQGGIESLPSGIKVDAILLPDARLAGGCLGRLPELLTPHGIAVICSSSGGNGGGAGSGGASGCASSSSGGSVDMQGGAGVTHARLSGSSGGGLEEEGGMLSDVMRGSFLLKARQSVPMVVQRDVDRFDVLLLDCCVWELGSK